MRSASQEVLPEWDREPALLARVVGVGGGVAAFGGEVLGYGGEAFGEFGGEGGLGFYLGVHFSQHGVRLRQGSPESWRFHQ